MTTLYRTVASFLLLAATVTAQAATTLPLEAGTYIEGGAHMQCAEAANAGTLYFDGNNLHGPHLEECKTATHIVGQGGRTYVTQSTCDEQDKDGRAIKQDTFRPIKVLDHTHFQLLIAHASPRDFHRCGAYPTR